MDRSYEPPVDTIILDTRQVLNKINPAKTLARQSSILALGTLFSRITGQFRSIALVAALGATGMAANAFDIANNIPNTILVIISGGILNSVLVPQIIKAKNYSDSQIRLNKLLTFLCLVILVITLILTLAAPFIIRLYAGVNWTSQQIEFAVAFSYLCMPQIFFYGLYTILGQVASANERFAVYGWAPVANNLISIIGFCVFIFYTSQIYKIDSINNFSAWNTPMILILCLTATLGIVAQSLLMFIPLQKSYFKFKPMFGLRGIGLREISNISFWSFMIVLLEEFVALVFIKIASDAPIAAGVMDTASIAGNAAYTQAVTIYIVPYSLVAVSLATTLFTKMAKSASQNNSKAVAWQLIKAMKTVSVFMVFASLCLLIEAPHIVKVLIPTVSLYSFGAISSILVPFSFILIPISNILLMKRVFFAYSDAKLVFIYSLPYAAVSLILVLVLTVFSPPYIWTFLIAVSVAIGYWLDFGFFLRGVRKKLGTNFNYISLFGFLIKIVICAVPTILSGVLVKYILGWTYYTAWWTAAGQLLIICLTMLGVYIFMLKFMKVEQLNFYAKPVISLLRKLTKKKLLNRKIDN
ncbi:MAG: hypothetical protein LBT91_01410 [Bifidobacteriaceae bacterium]|jgi:putative peptidoglycan lipid II flippase|nr:hypothetical protein [Bifidobacteriaceae bacterium]